MIHEIAAFTPEECEAVIALRTEDRVKPAPVWGGESYIVDPRVRDVSTCYRERCRETAWLYERLDALFAEAAAALGTAVVPIAEPVQLLRYEVGGHYQAWHTDAGADLDRERRISVSVELSDAADYQGGELQLMPPRPPGPRSGRGTACFFPSRALHRVTPVTRGVRHALVIWAPAA